MLQIEKTCDVLSGSSQAIDRLMFCVKFTLLYWIVGLEGREKLLNGILAVLALSIRYIHVFVPLNELKSTL